MRGDRTRSPVAPRTPLVAIELGRRIARHAPLLRHSASRPSARRKAGELGRRAAAGGVQPGLRSHTNACGNAPNDHKQRRIPTADPRPESRRSTRPPPRIAQARDHNPRATRLAVPDRDLRPRLPQIELADLPRPIDRPLKRPRRREQRPHLSQVVIDDRRAAIRPRRRDQLPDPLAADRRRPRRAVDGSHP
jgi:hypothetical protein